MNIYAHRGASLDFPENTLLGFEYALQNGAQGIEVDIQRSRDGRIVVIHDETVQRTFLGRGNVRGMTLEELQNLQQRRIHFQDNPACKVCTLEDVLELAKPYVNSMVHIEFKTNLIPYEGIEEQVVQLVKQYDMSKQVWFSSFNVNTLKRCKALAPDIGVGILQHLRESGLVEKAIENGFEAIHPNFEILTPVLIQEAKDAGLIINTYTVNMPWTMRLLKKSRVDGVFTDDPVLCQEVLAETGR